MNRQFRKAVKAQARKVPLADRPDFYRYICGQRRWPHTADELGKADALIKNLSSRLAWYHGGLAGREAGDYLLPSEVTGEDPRNQRDQFPTRGAHVYITPSPELAGTYAVQCGDRDGALYMVEPEGKLGFDVEALRPLLFMLQDRELVREHGRETLIENAKAFTCPRARVLKVVHRISAEVAAEIVRGARADALSENNGKISDRELWAWAQGWGMA